VFFLYVEAPSFSRRMDNKWTREGDTAVLECMASGSPRPRVTWLKDGVTLMPTLRHFFTADDQLLVIVQTEASDAGDYMCVLTNTLGSDRQV
jgi:leucine-rich repeats and immunoglobulin-like domains protein 1/3